MGPHPTQAERDSILKLHFEKGYSTRLLASKTRFSRTAIMNWLREYRKSSDFIDIPAIKRKRKKESDARKIRALEAEVEILRSFLTAYERGVAKASNIKL